MVTPKLLTTAEAAAEANVSTSRMRALLNQGRIKGAGKIRRDWAIPGPVVILKGAPMRDRRRGE